MERAGVSLLGQGRLKEKGCNAQRALCSSHIYRLQAGQKFSNPLTHADQCSLSHTDYSVELIRDQSWVEPLYDRMCCNCWSCIFCVTLMRQRATANFSVT